MAKKQKADPLIDCEIKKDLFVKAVRNMLLSNNFPASKGGNPPFVYARQIFTLIFNLYDQLDELAANLVKQLEVLGVRPDQIPEWKAMDEAEIASASTKRARSRFISVALRNAVAIF